MDTMAQKKGSVSEPLKNQAITQMDMVRPLQRHARTVIIPTVIQSKSKESVQGENNAMTHFIA